MRYVLKAENEEEKKMLESKSHFKTFLDTYLPVVQGRSIMAGVHLKIFETIGYKELSLEELAKELYLNTESLGLLLNVLVCSEYLNCNEGRYTLTELSKKTLLPDSPFPAWAGIEYSRIRWKMLDNLEDIIKTGEGVDLHQDFLKKQNGWQYYQRNMYEFANLSSDRISSCIQVGPNPEKMLDIGGSHGLYGAKICRKNPPMKSVVFDLPEAVKASAVLAREAGIDDVVSFKPGDALKDDLGSGYDLVFVSSLCHHFTKENNQKLLSKIIKALKKGGKVAICGSKPPDFFNNRNTINAVSSLMFRVNSGGQNYSDKDYISWAESAGFKQVALNPEFLESPQILITGIK